MTPASILSALVMVLVGPIPVRAAGAVVVEPVPALVVQGFRTWQLLLGIGLVSNFRRNLATSPLSQRRSSARFAWVGLPCFSPLSGSTNKGETVQSVARHGLRKRPGRGEGVIGRSGAGDRGLGTRDGQCGTSVRQAAGTLRESFFGPAHDSLTPFETLVRRLWGSVHCGSIGTLIPRLLQTPQVWQSRCPKNHSGVLRKSVRSWGLPTLIHLSLGATGAIGRLLHVLSSRAQVAPM